MNGLAISNTRSGSIFGGSVATIRQIGPEEGILGFLQLKGLSLSASYLGVTEGTIQWVLYERLKRLTASTNGTGGMLGSARTAKCVPSLITNPHEVHQPHTPDAQI